MSQPKIYVADLKAYNEGKLIGEWLDLDDYDSGWEVMDAITDLTDEWAEEHHDGDETEYAIHDYEGFGEDLYSESMGENEFDTIIATTKLSDKTDIPVEILQDFMNDSSIDPEDLESRVDEQYFGYYDDDYRLAEAYVDELGGVSELGDNTIETYFDYESFGKDLAMDFSEYDGHYFRSYAKGGKVPKYRLSKYEKGGTLTDIVAIQLDSDWDSTLFDCVAKYEGIEVRRLRSNRRNVYEFVEGNFATELYENEKIGLEMSLAEAGCDNYSFITEDEYMTDYEKGGQLEMAKAMKGVAKRGEDKISAERQNIKQMRGFQKEAEQSIGRHEKAIKDAEKSIKDYDKTIADNKKDMLKTYKEVEKAKREAVKYDEGGTIEIVAKNFDPYAVKIEDGREKGAKTGFVSVLIKDRNSDFSAWVDVNIDEEDYDYDWNQYIFHLDDPADVRQKALQENNYIFDLATSEATGHLMEKGIIEDYARGGRIMSVERLAQKLERAYPNIYLREDDDSISIFENFPEDRRGHSIADYYSDAEDRTFGVKNHFNNFLERNGYWAEWQNPGHLKIWKRDFAKGGYLKNVEVPKDSPFWKMTERELKDEIINSYHYKKRFTMHKANNKKSIRNNRNFDVKEMHRRLRQDSDFWDRERKKEDDKLKQLRKVHMEKFGVVDYIPSGVTAGSRGREYYRYAKGGMTMYDAPDTKIGKVKFSMAKDQDFDIEVPEGKYRLLRAKPFDIPTEIIDMNRGNNFEKLSVNDSPIAHKYQKEIQEFYNQDKSRFAKGGEIEKIVSYVVEGDEMGHDIWHYDNLDEAEMKWESLTDKQKKEGTFYKEHWECKDGVCDIEDVEIIYAKGGYIYDITGVNEDDLETIYVGGRYYDGEEFYDDEETTDLKEVIREWRDMTTDSNYLTDEDGNLITDRAVDEYDIYLIYKNGDKKIIDGYTAHRIAESFARGGKVKKKQNNEMIIGGLAGILLGIFLNR